jgi:hypothetical protein
MGKALVLKGADFHMERHRFDNSALQQGLITST